MQTPATRLLENIIREELTLIREDNGPSDLEKFDGKQLPEPTATSIQKFFGLSVDGIFGDKTSKAVADFIYGPKNGHGIDTVEELYDRMKSDGWDVGAKTGTIFANNGKMANSILRLMQIRSQLTANKVRSSLFRISTSNLDHPAYSNYPNLKKVKYGLDYGGRDSWSTIELDLSREQEKTTGENPNKPKGLDTQKVFEDTFEIYRDFIKRSYQGVITIKPGHGVKELVTTCNVLPKLMQTLTTITINELAALSQQYSKQGKTSRNMFKHIIDAGTKYYQYIIGEKLVNGQPTKGTKVYNTRPPAACHLSPKQIVDLWATMGQVEDHINKLINLAPAYYKDTRTPGDDWLELRKDIADSLYELGQFLDSPNYDKNTTKPKIAPSKGILAQIGKYGLGQPGGAEAMALYNVMQDYPHETLLVLGILSDFVPVIGWAMSAGFFAADAELYRREGKYYDAGISAIFVVLPMLSKIPMFKAYSAAFFERLGVKLSAEKAVKLAVAEKTFINTLVANKQMVQQQLKNLIRREIARQTPRINYATIAKDPVAIILRKIVNGTLELERVAKYFGAQLTLELGKFLTAEKAWEYLMHLTGLDKKTLETFNPSEVNKLIKSDPDEMQTIRKQKENE